MLGFKMEELLEAHVTHEADASVSTTQVQSAYMEYTIQ